jgi:hypothetical protein
MLNSRRFSLAAVFYVIATVIKPQAVIVAPAYALFYLNSLSFRAIITHAIYGAATFFAITFPFFGLSSVQQLYQVLNSSINTYPYGSINTFNIWGLYGFWKSDTTLFAFGLTQQQFGSLLFLCIATVTFCSLLILGKKKAHDIQMLYFSLYSSFLVLIGVLVLTRMHERYVFPFFFYALAGFIYFLSLHSTSLTRISRSTIRVLLPAFVGIYAILVGIHVVNLYYVYVYYIYFNIGVPAENTLFFAIENSLVLWSNMQILFTLLYVTVIGIILVNVRKAHHGS